MKRNEGRRALLVTLTAVIAFWAAPCASARPTVVTDLVYGSVGGTKLLLDAYAPEAAGPMRPCVVLIHGGGFIGGKKEFYAPTAARLAARGYVAFSIDYRLAPKYPYPAQIDDCQRAVRWIRAHGADYGIDTTRIGAMGDSAGGYLATMLGTRETRDNSAPELAGFSSRVSCVVDLYGPSDFTVPAKTAGISADAIFILSMYFGKPQDQAMAQYREGSPIIYVNKQSAPFLIVHGTADMLVPLNQSERLYDALKSAGVDATLVELYKYPHGFLKPASPKQTDLLADQFLDEHLKP